MEFSRTKKLKLNAIMGLIKQLTVVVCGFILPRVILKGYGSEVNGLISSITQFLGFIGFLDMGLGPVVQSNLYGPLSNRNYKEISKILKSATLFFRKLAYIFIIYIVILSVAYPIVINSTFDFWFTSSLVIIISISTLVEYLFGIKYQLLLNADQLAFVQLFIQMMSTILNTILTVLLVNIGASIQVVKLVAAIIYIIRPICLMMYVNKNYRIDYNIKYDIEPIKQKWNGFAQHVAGVVVANTDVVVLTFFSTLSTVSVYSIYYLVVKGVSDIVMTTVTGLEALWGNMLAQKESKELIKSYNKTEWLIHNCVTLVFTITGVLIVPFVEIYTSGITDVDYRAPAFAIILVAAYGMQAIRVPYFRIIKAAGHYKETQNGSFIQMTINVIVSIILVIRLGLVGVAIGTFLAMSYHTVYFAWYLRKNILNRNIGYFVRHIIIDIIQCCCIVAATFWIQLSSCSYLSWIIMAIEVSSIAIIICIIVNLLFNKEVTVQLLRKVYKTKGVQDE